MGIKFRLLTLMLSVFALGFMQGCATLNQSECQAANWEIIGLEDGSAGRASSYLGQHRSACAEYGIAPDLNAYLKGHKQGLNQYCSYQGGYSLGERGSSFNSVCPGAEYPEFSRGYQRGKQAWGYISEIRQLSNSIQSHHNRLHDLERQIKYKEDVIVAEGTTLEQRRDLLEEVKLMSSEITEINNELPYLEDELIKVEQRYESFKRR